MQQGSLLYEKEIDSYRPLGAFGQPVHRAYVQLRAAVAQRLGPRCANLFARPQIDERSRTIRWISPVPGESLHWRDLGPEDQAERALDLQILRGEFEGYLAELRKAGGDSGGEAFSSVLEQSLKTPNDGHLHFVGDQPVMTFWGFTELDGELFEPLTAGPPLARGAAPGPSVAPAPAAAAGAGWSLPGWLLWLLPLLLLLLLLALLLWWLWGDDGTATDPGADPVPPVVGTDPPAEEFRVLPGRTDPDGRPVIVDRDGIAVDPALLRVDPDGRVIAPDGSVIDGVAPDELGLVPGDGAGTAPPDPPANGEMPGEDAAPVEEAMPPGIEDGAAAPGEAPAPAEPPEPPLPAGEEADPAEPPAEGAAEEPAAPPADAAGEEPGPDEAADPAQGDPAAAGEPEQPEAGEPLQIPPATPGTGAEPGAASGAAQTGPAGFMRGRWSSNSALADEQGNRLSQTYRFDEQGVGQSVIRRADGSECTAPATARMESGRLLITEQDNPTCPDGRQFEKSETICEVDASGQTRCRGNGYDVQIERAGQ